MKAVRAQFRPACAPGRSARWILALAALAVLGLTGWAAWQRTRVDVLSRRVLELRAELRAGSRPPAPKQPAPYAASAEAMLRERAAAWAPMLRSLESAAVVGVTPVALQFDAVQGSARAELHYSDPAALFDYLDRLDAGKSPSDPFGRWRLIRSRTPTRDTESRPGGAAAGPATSSADIESDWAPGH